MSTTISEQLTIKTKNVSVRHDLSIGDIAGLLAFAVADGIASEFSNIDEDDFPTDEKTAHRIVKLALLRRGQDAIHMAGYLKTGLYAKGLARARELYSDLIN